jgi:AcrR family transcriptional regulator
MGRDDWVAGALDLLAREGVEAVRVEPLARDLGVTKGSFYWHFKDRDDLLAALPGVWSDQEIERFAAGVSGKGKPKRQLKRLAGLLAGATANASPEAAIRNWARQDPRAAEAIGRVDRKRLRILERAFRACGAKRKQARARARLFYSLILAQPMIRPKGENEMDANAVVARALGLLMKV